VTIEDAMNEYDDAITNDAKEKKTQSQVLVGLASDMELFHNELGDSFARVRVGNHFEVWPIRSKTLRLILTSRYLNITTDKAPGGQAMEDALMVLEVRAQFQGKRETVHTRIAEIDDSIFLDLCNSDWQVVQIDSNGWRLLVDSPVHFIRSKTMKSLPRPVVGGSIVELKQFINYKDEDNFKLIIAWLLATFKENSPFPILTIQGEQGAAKSTTTKILRSIIDPSQLPLRGLPKDERDLSIAAKHTWILAFDNLSGFSAATSDALCKLSTGGGLATRKLHSDDEEMVFNSMRPTILNGIEDIAERHDLLDRSIIINLPSITDSERNDEKELWEQFHLKHSRILGALCEVVSKAIKEFPTTKLDHKPRLADFALWMTAAEKALGWYEREFIAIYDRNREQAIDQGIELDPFALAIVELVEKNSVWVGNATQLVEQAANYTDGETRKSKEWPTPRKVRNRLRRINPALKKKNILYIEWENRKTKTMKLERLNKIT